MHFVGNSLTMVSWNLNSVLHSPECHKLLTQAEYPSGSPSALLTRFGPLQVPQLPQAEYHPQEKMISTHYTDKTNYNLAGAGHSRIGLLQMWCTVEELLESTHIVWSNALYRRRQSNLLSALVLLEWILSWILFSVLSWLLWLCLISCKLEEIFPVHI